MGEEAMDGEDGMRRERVMERGVEVAPYSPKGVTSDYGRTQTLGSLTIMAARPTPLAPPLTTTTNTKVAIFCASRNYRPEESACDSQMKGYTRNSSGAGWGGRGGAGWGRRMVSPHHHKLRQRYKLVTAIDLIMKPKITA